MTEPETWGFGCPEVVPEIVRDDALGVGSRRMTFVLYPTDETPRDSEWTVRVFCRLASGQRDPRSAVDQLATLVRPNSLRELHANPEAIIVGDEIQHVFVGMHCRVTYDPPAEWALAKLELTIQAIMEAL